MLGDWNPFAWPLVPCLVFLSLLRQSLDYFQTWDPPTSVSLVLGCRHEPPHLSVSTLESWLSLLEARVFGKGLSYFLLHGKTLAETWQGSERKASIAPYSSQMRNSCPERYFWFWNSDSQRGIFWFLLMEWAYWERKQVILLKLCNKCLPS